MQLTGADSSSFLIGKTRVTSNFPSDPWLLSCSHSCCVLVDHFRTMSVHISFGPRRLVLFRKSECHQGGRYPQSRRSSSRDQTTRTWSSKNGCCCYLGTSGTPDRLNPIGSASAPCFCPMVPTMKTWKRSSRVFPVVTSGGEPIRRGALSITLVEYCAGVRR